MENTKSLIVGLIVIILIIAGGIFFYRQSVLPKIIGQVTPTPNGFIKSSEQIISLSSKGFSPPTLIVNVGTKVGWINNSGVDGDIESDPHPTHTSYPPINFGVFSSGSLVEIVFDKPGTYHYHNHLNPSQKGTVIVQ
jgi:plastocyanin